MAKSKRKILKIGAILAILILVWVGYTQYPRLNLIAGYSAKMMSTSVFLANRSLEFTDENDHNFTPVKIAKNKMDTEDKSVTASVYGLLSRKAVYREGLGSVLKINAEDEIPVIPVPKRNRMSTTLSYPYGNAKQQDTIFEAINYANLTSVVDSAFSNSTVKKTRAVLVIYKDQIIAEKYREGFDENSLLMGWSMVKSITSTIYGILQKEGRLNIMDPAPIETWKNDSRAAITLSDLLHMNSGLAWDEDYTKISDATKMLFLSRDMTTAQKEKELVAKPNTLWNYSSGTSNLLSGIIRSQFNTHQAYLDYWYTALIDRIGMHSMVLEADLVGNYVGSSYGWATTRDWAKFGLLYLHRGNWNGDQVFDQEWVDYITTPTATSNGEYGGHFWLNTGGKYPDAPRDLYSANGFQGQRVFIIPSKELVIVRMGLAGESGFDFNAFLSDITKAVK